MTDESQAPEATEEPSVRVRDMPWPQMRQLLMQIGPEIGALVKRGDKFAKAVRERYQYAYEHPTDEKANFELRTAIEDYVNRDLRDAERAELGSKYNHRTGIIERKKVQVFVPGPTRTQ